MSIRASRAPAPSRICTCRFAPGRDIAFLGGIIRYILENERYFREYVVNYTNAPAIISEEFSDTEELDGLFSGWDEEKGKYDIEAWMYEGVEPEPAAERARADGRSRIPSSGSRFRRSIRTRRCSIRAACSRF